MIIDTTMKNYTYNTLNFSINKKWGNGFSTFAGVDNILNKEVDDLYIDGRLWRVGRRMEILKGFFHEHITHTTTPLPLNGHGRLLCGEEWPEQPLRLLRRRGTGRRMDRRSDTEIRIDSRDAGRLKRLSGDFLRRISR